jgi:hypothetical protein
MRFGSLNISVCVLPSGDILLHYLKKKIRNKISNKHLLQVCVKFVQRNVKVVLGKEKEKRLCGGVLIVKSYSECQSASNCSTEGHTICIYFLRRFFPL